MSDRNENRRQVTTSQAWLVVRYGKYNWLFRVMYNLVLTSSEW